MITATDTAINELISHFDGKDVQPIRIHLVDGGCSGKKLSMSMDEARDGDKAIEQDVFTFVIHEELADAAGQVTIDMGDYGFSIASEKEIGGGSGCNCASGGGCGGRR
ncbi:MAG: IscA/HesB family protein [Pseudodesulfovibrio sp.]